MDLTTNYSLKKPLSTENYDVANQNDNMDIIDAQLKARADAQAAHEADNAKQIPHLGTTTNVGDAYRITTTETIDSNEKFTIKFNAASTTAPTLSINGGTAYAIKKANGGNAKLYASVYTLFWDGINFILLGEGGEYGTAGAAQTLTGYTLGTENGVIPGTMPNKVGSGTVITPSTVDQAIPQGYYGGAVGDGKVLASGAKATVQKFQYATLTLNASGYLDITISSVDVTKSVVTICANRYNNTGYSDIASVSVNITSSTTVRVNGYANASYVDAVITVTTYLNAKSVQKGIAALSVDGNTNVTISSVDPLKSNLIFSGWNHSYQQQLQLGPSGYISSSTNLVLTRPTVGAGYSFGTWWNIVEFY